MKDQQRRFAQFCWLSLALVLGVIVWGAYVRASGSGAGCGSHWPTCDGEVIPRTMGSKKAVELFHRVTSGLSGILLLVQVVWGFSLFPSGHKGRRALLWSGLFMLGEVLIGAGIVLLKYVADDQSVGRAVWMAVHLVNTFLLVGAMTLAAQLAAQFASQHATNPAAAAERPIAGDEAHPPGEQNNDVRLIALSAAATLLVGVSGAIAALGDTLFPASSLTGALAADLSTTAHVLVRLRVAHPFVAIAAVLLLLFTRHSLMSRRESAQLERWGLWLKVALYAQVAAGMLNLVLLAPIWMQLLHLLLAQGLWIALVLFAATALATPSRRAQEVSALGTR